MEYIKRFKDIALDCYNHCEEKTLVEMCMGNMIMEYRAVLENLEISQFAQLLQKARKIAQSVRSSSYGPKEQKSTLQAITVSIDEKKRKSDGREYETPSPLPSTPKELDILLDNGLQMGFSSPIKFLSNPLKKSKRTHASVVYTIICNTLPQNGEHSVD